MKPPRTAIFALAISLVFATGCAAQVASARRGDGASRAVTISDADCASWLSARRAWTAVGVVFAGVTAGAAPVRELLPDTTATSLTFGLGALATGALAAVASYLSGSYATDFGRYCTAADPAP